MIKGKMLLLFSVLPSLIVAIFIPFLPVNVPMHYDSNGIVDRLGSKFKLLSLLHYF